MSEHHPNPLRIAGAQPAAAERALDLAALRARLAGRSGPEYWRGLEELAATPEFTAFLHREFPENASEWTDPRGRRNFLKLMAASLALAGLGACTRQPAERIVPFVRAPEEYIPGKALHYATVIPLGGYARGVLVESHMGRPTKIEGNELHPASLGATDVCTQAAILDLYDPDRSQVTLDRQRWSQWSTFLAAATRALQEQKARRGRGLRILTETVTSPTLAAQIQALLADYPEARWHQWEPLNRDNARAGARLAFGAYVDTHYRFDRAGVVLSLDADFLYHGPAAVRYARDFSARRRISSEKKDMNRLYVAEPSPTTTGAMADHRLALRPSQVEALARHLAARLGVAVEAGPLPEAPASPRPLAAWLSAVAGDLERARGRGIVIAGEAQPPAVHALAHAINAALGNSGATVVYTDPVEASPVEQLESLRELVSDMDAGRVQMLVMLGGNPVYNAPADFQFARRLDKVPLRIHLGLYEDETSYLCHWHVPETHALETWSDARAFEGTASIQQPLIAPLYSGCRSAHELLAALAGQPGRSGYEIVREHWRGRRGRESDAAFETWWRRAVHDGVIAGTALPARTPALARDLAARLGPPPAAGATELAFAPDPNVLDGSRANNAWLQELPKPLTKLTWENAALVSPQTARRLGVQNGDVLEVHHAGRSIEIPAWIQPGQAEGCLTLHLGYGRRRAGRVGKDIGADVYALRTAAAAWFAGGEVARTGRRTRLASTQLHHSMEGRALVRTAGVDAYHADPSIIRKMWPEFPASLTMYPGFEYTGYAWGMAIDLNACTGCNACVVACQAENNIPVVGKEQVAVGREMHWVRVDRYFKGDMDSPEIVHQPVPCMHCENAPCEVVCPVAATVHSDEGLNDMVYNRCVGTRYCSNNCPYKVRRFNFLQYVDTTTESLKLQRNPNVTVRMRGVMEKCTYCVQRINAARITAEKEGRKIGDGEIVTACQQVCPAGAIVFGDINDPSSRVSKLKAEQRNYGILEDINTRPRTTYLARLRNPNPELE